MPMAQVGDVRIAYDTFGDPSAPAVLLIMGLGSQMLAWRGGFCREIARQGFFVIRYDNRDIGLSSRVTHRPAQTVATLARRRLGQRVDPPYKLRDMADDAVGLLDELGVARAHLVGASMGGMIAQLCAIHHPHRVLSLTSMMSTTGDPDLPKPDWRVRYSLLRSMPAVPETQIERLVSIRRLVGSKHFFYEDDIRAYFARVVARSADRTGVPRQALAVLCAGSRRRALSQLRVPTLVLHGTDDILLPPAHGVRTANTVPGAKLQLIPKLGHDLPRPMWGDLASRIVDHVGA
ncbi:MAG: alpha/beta fold hydrolase [Myxococcota bacterium]